MIQFKSPLKPYHKVREEGDEVADGNRGCPYGFQGDGQFDLSKNARGGAAAWLRRREGLPV